jgi:hypothetical protein
MHQTRCMLALTICVLLTSAVRICTAATFTCAAGDTACLIASINTANSTPEADTIQLAAGTYTLTTVDHTTDGANGLPSIISDLAIQGVGADATIIKRDTGAHTNPPIFRLFHVGATGTLTLDGLTIRGGHIFGGPRGGGAS